MKSTPGGMEEVTSTVAETQAMVVSDSRGRTEARDVN